MEPQTIVKNTKVINVAFMATVNQAKKIYLCGPVMCPFGEVDISPAEEQPRLNANGSIMSTEVSRNKLSGPSAAWTRPSSVQGRIYKVNRRKAREGPLGDSAS